MNCIHGIDMGESCRSCTFNGGEGYRITENHHRVAEQDKPMTTGKVREEDDIPYGDPIAYVALHQSSVKRMDESIAQLARNVAGLTGVAQALLAIGERISPTPGPVMERGDITEHEVDAALGRLHLSQYWAASMRIALENFARSRGVL